MAQGEDVLEGLNFVDNVGGVKHLWLKNGNPTAHFNAFIRASHGCIGQSAQGRWWTGHLKCVVTQS